MQTRYASLVFIIVLATLFSCTKQAEVQPAYIGTWNWIRTEGGVAAQVHDTPASSGRAMELQLLSNGTYVYKTNGEITSSGTFRVEKRKCIHDHTQKDFLLFSADQGMMIESLAGSQLKLSDEAYDGLWSLYTHK